MKGKDYGANPEKSVNAMCVSYHFIISVLMLISYLHFDYLNHPTQYGKS